MRESLKTYIRAAGRDWLLPFYDPIVKLLGIDLARRTLLDQAAIRPRHRILDIGCGTGSLVTLIKRLHPDADVVGLDPDPKALARARRKAERAAVSIQFDQGFSEKLPYPEASFDRVFSSFMFHHLKPDALSASLTRENCFVSARTLTSANVLRETDKFPPIVEGSESHVQH